MKTLERVEKKIAQLESIIELGGPSIGERRYYMEGMLYALRWIQKEETIQGILQEKGK